MVIHPATGICIGIGILVIGIWIGVRCRPANDNDYRSWRDGFAAGVNWVRLVGDKDEKSKTGPDTAGP